jgi:hypothetical protein
LLSAPGCQSMTACLHGATASSHGTPDTCNTDEREGVCGHIGLSDAGASLSGALGNQSSLIWAIGLLASAQSSTVTVTYAGQYLSEGFTQVSDSPPSPSLSPPHLHRANPSSISVFSFAEASHFRSLFSLLRFSRWTPPPRWWMRSRSGGTSSPLSARRSPFFR